MMAGALLRWRDRAARALARPAAHVDTSADSAQLSAIGLQHAREALASSRPASSAQAAYRAEAIARLDSQIRARIAKGAVGLSPAPSTRDAAHGPAAPCAGCAKVRAAFATVSDHIAAALAPGKPGPIQARISAQLAGERGPLQAAIDRFHGGAQ